MLPTDILNYRIVRHLGSGGMGSVYLAVNTNIDQQVAIKVLRPEIARNPILGTVVKRLKLYNRLIVNVIENSYLCVGKKNTSNRPRKAEFGGIAKINLHGKGTKFLRNITGSSVHRV